MGLQVGPRVAQHWPPTRAWLFAGQHALDAGRGIAAHHELVVGQVVDEQPDDGAEALLGHLIPKRLGEFEGICLKDILVVVFHVVHVLVDYRLYHLLTIEQKLEKKVFCLFFLHGHIF